MLRNMNEIGSDESEDDLQRFESTAGRIKGFRASYDGHGSALRKRDLS
jgi:hypothetical protein